MMNRAHAVMRVSHVVIRALLNVKAIQLYKRALILTCTMLSTALIGYPGSSQAALLNLNNVPPYLSGNVAPNIMFMLDNSGSMSNIVPDVPYDANIVYLTSCPSGNTVPGGVASPAFPSSSDTFDIRIISGAPKIRIGGANYDWGIGSEQRCFDPTLRYNARLNATGSCGEGCYAPISYLDAVYTGNYLNWYFGSSPTTWGSTGRRKPGTQSRMEIAQTAAKNLMDSLSNVRVGLSSYNGSTGGTLNEVIGDISSNRTSIKSKIDALTPSGMTPLAETLSDIGRYFTTGYSGSLTLHPGQSNQSTESIAPVFSNHAINNASGIASPPAPIQNFCQKSFAVLMTDGRPQGDQAITGSLADYDGDCSGTNASNCVSTTPNYDKKLGQDYESLGSDFLDDVAQGLFEMDLRPDLTDPAGEPKKNNLITYTIGFADEQVINDPLMQDTAQQGGGLFITAQNASQLSQAFQAAISSIANASSTSAASVATNTTSLSTDTRLYQSLFNSADWSGALKAIDVNPTTGAVEDVVWNAANELKAQNFDTGRAILTYNRDSTARDGARFRWSNIGAANQAALHDDPSTAAVDNDAEGAARLDYLRGDAAHEGTGNNYRQRLDSSGSHWKLGDIVHSAPFYVGKPPYMYPDKNPDGTNFESQSYSAFVAANDTDAERTPMVYVGANDGMLHGFDANTGVEKIAYIPGAVYTHLSKLTDPNYVHRYYVDGKIFVGDAFVNTGWMSVLTGTLGGGGQGVFAFDVTTPGNFSEANASSLVLWEFTDEHDADLGYTYGQASVVKMQNGEWAVVFGNGYNNTEADGHASTTGYAVLYIAFIEKGLDGDWTDAGDVIKISTKTGTTGTPNGLAEPAPVDVDGDDVIDYIYAGDLQGNVWKFDVSSATTGGWKVAYGSSGKPEPLFTAKDASDTPQPITTRPEVGLHPAGKTGVMVYVVTGKYLEALDNSSTGQQTQSVYGIWDNDDTVSGRSALRQQEILEELDQTFGSITYTLRALSDYSVDWSSKKGWYLDLVNTEGNNTNNYGERAVTNPVLRNGKLVFTTVLPSTEPCKFGGEGWLMELDAGTGGQLAFSPFDLDDNNEFTRWDYIQVSYDVNGDGEVNDQDKIPAGGQKMEAIPAEPAFVNGSDAGDPEIKYISLSNGAVKPVKNNPGPGQEGRQSWRQLR